MHRIGRTGRAGNTGIAISFASHMDRHQVRKIEQFTGQRLEPSVIAGFEPKRPAPRTDGPGRGRPGDRSSRPSNGRPGDRSGRPGERNRSFGDRASERSFGDRAASAGDRNSRPSGNAGANTGYPGSGKPRGTGFGSRPEGSSRPEGNRSFGDRAASPGDRNSRPTGNRPDGNRNSRPEGNRGGDKFGGPKRADGDRAARRPRNFA